MVANRTHLLLVPVRHVESFYNREKINVRMINVSLQAERLRVYYLNLNDNDHFLFGASYESFVNQFINFFIPNNMFIYAFRLSIKIFRYVQLNRYDRNGWKTILHNLTIFTIQM